MKTNVQVKDEPVELQVNELLRLYGYNLTDSSTIKPSRTKSIVNNQEQESSTCAWCQKLGVRSFTLRTDNGDSKTLCSEVCFNQYRRASFKKNKGSETDTDHNTLPVISSIKTKSPEKKNGTSKYEQQSIDSNRRKLLFPHRRPTPIIAKTKSNGIVRKSILSPLPPPPPPPPSKRHRSSSSSTTTSSSSQSNGKILRVDQTLATPSNLPVSFTWQPSLLLPSTIPWSSSIDINRFQYPIFAPPPPPLSLPLAAPAPHPPLPLPAPASSSSVLPTTPSNLFTTLSKGTLSSFTCILPTFIPLPIPIPIPLCFPIHVPCVKCSVKVNNQQSQTIIQDNTNQKRTRRTSL
ncbi:unnamed protein product [Adineta steineri]|uniref:Uncharacterized protein n=1 Tax=Adineta steineri TaxID=433720 RepID=A0A815H4Y1_9BILA|nr:unnamed protein product [Adineta steineri]CAF1347221.1 unnamed protein product [Adineta steineri]